MSAITHPIFLSGFGAGTLVAVLMGASRWKRWKQRIATWQAFAGQRGLTLNVPPVLADRPYWPAGAP